MPKQKKHLIYTADQRGGLKECLETEKPITYDTFWRLVKAEIYRYYAYDERIKAYRYILTEIENNIGLPIWINYYGIRRPL